MICSDRRHILAAFVACSLSACATVTRSSMQEIRVESQPSGATVRLKDCGQGSTQRGQTPGVVMVSRQALHCNLAFSAPGYRDETYNLHRDYSPVSNFRSDRCIENSHNCTSESAWFSHLLVAIVLDPIGSG